MNTTQRLLAELGLNNESVFFSADENAESDFYERLFLEKDRLYLTIVSQLPKEKMNQEIDKHLKNFFGNLKEQRFVSGFAEESIEYFFLDKLMRNYNLRIDQLFVMYLDDYVQFYESLDFIIPDLNLVYELLPSQTRQDKYRKAFEKINREKLQKKEEAQKRYWDERDKEALAKQEYNKKIESLLANLNEESTSDEVTELCLCLMTRENLALSAAEIILKRKIARKLTSQENERVILDVISFHVEKGDATKASTIMTWYANKKMIQKSGFTDKELKTLMRVKIENNHPVQEIFNLVEGYGGRIPLDKLDSMIHSYLQAGNVKGVEKIARIHSRDILTYEYELALPFYQEKMRSQLSVNEKASLLKIVSTIKVLTEKAQKPELFKTLMINFIKENTVLGKGEDGKHRCSNLLELLFLSEINEEDREIIFKNFLKVFQGIIFNNNETSLKVVEKIKTMHQYGFNLFFEMFLFSAQDFVSKNRTNLNHEELDKIKKSLKRSIDSLIVHKILKK